MMRKGKDLSTSSVKDNSRNPKPISGSSDKVEKQETSTSRSLRSNSRSESSSRPIRINRDCLKGIPITPKRVDKRTRPFIQKSKKSSNATPPASETKPRVPASPEGKPRAPVPRVTPHSCIKTTETTIQPIRILRSGPVPRTIQSSRTGTVAKISTTTASTQTPSRIIRTSVASTRNAVTINKKPNSPKFTWNLRSRSSISKPDSKTTKDDETKPLRKRRAVKDIECTPVKRLAIAREEGSKQKKQPQVVKVEEKVTKAPLVKEQQQQRKVDINLNKGQKSSDEVKLSEPCSERIEAVSRSEDAEEIPCTEKTCSAIESPTKPLVPKQNLEERPLTPIDPEATSFGEDANVDVCEVLSTSMAEEVSKETPLVANDETSKSSHKSLEVTATPLTLHVNVVTSISGKDQPSSDEKPVSSKPEQVVIPPVTKTEHEERILCNDVPVVEPRLEDEIALKTSEVNSQNCRDKSSTFVADISPVETPASAEAIDQLRGTKAEKSKSLLAEPSTVVKEQLHPVTTSTCSQPTTRSPRIESSNAFKIQAWKEKLSFTEFKTNKSCETSTSENAKWQISLDAAKGERLLQSTSRKRRGGTPPLENEILTKKWRSSSPMNGQFNPKAFSFSDQSCSTQLMDIGGLTPAVSSLNMEVDTSGILPFAFNLTFNRFPSVLNAQNGQNISEDMELCDSGSSLTLTSPFGRHQKPLRPFFGRQPFGLSFASTSQTTRQPSFGFSQTTSQHFSFGNGFGQTGMQNKQTAFGNVPQAPPLPFGGLSQNVFGKQPQQSQSSAMFTIPKAPPVPVGGFGKVGNQRFMFGCATRQTNQSSPVFGGGVNQINQSHTFGNASILKMHQTLFKSDRPPREFILTKGQRRRNVEKTWCNFNQTRNQVFGFQTNPQQVFGSLGMVQSPTPMESEDVSNLSGTFFGGLNNRPPNAFGNGCGQVIFGSLQSTPGQNLNDHTMEDIPETPSFSNGMLPYRSTASCFAISSQTKEIRPPPQRTVSLPQMAVTSAVGTPAPPSSPVSPPASPVIKPARLQPPSSAGKGFTNMLYSSVHPRRTFATPETTTNIARQDTSFQLNLDEDEVSPRLHKIYSSVSSLCSISSEDSDGESEIDALIETLSDCISNCSLEDNPEPNEVGKLAAKFNKLSIMD